MILHNEIMGELYLSTLLTLRRTETCISLNITIAFKEYKRKSRRRQIYLYVKSNKLLYEEIK